MIRAFVVALLLGWPGLAQWNQFRGPNGSGAASPSAGYPVEFSPSRNVVWKQAVPFGRSSPVILDGRIYFTASESVPSPRLITICLDAATGKELWRREIRRERFTAVYARNDPASPSPVADADGVIVFFGDFGLAAYTREGKDRWTIPLGPFKNHYGMAASPIVVGDVVVLVCDQQGGSYVLAVDRKTGVQKWKTARPASTLGWATPAVLRPSSGPAQLVVLGSTRVDGYFLDTGEPRWWMPVGSEGGIGTPVILGDTVFATLNGTGQVWMPAFEPQLEQYDKNRDGRLSREEFTDKSWVPHFGWLDADGDGFITAKEWTEARAMGMGESGVFAIRAGEAKGKVDPASVSWRFKKNLPFIPSPLVYDGVFYMVRDGGIVTSLDAASGKLLKEGRNREAIGEYEASPVAADGKVYLASSAGKVTVLKANGEWEVLATNDLAGEISATPALAGGRIYVRTHAAMYCFGARR